MIVVAEVGYVRLIYHDHGRAGAGGGRDAPKPPDERDRPDGAFRRPPRASPASMLSVVLLETYNGIYEDDDRSGRRRAGPRGQGTRHDDKEGHGQRRALLRGPAPPADRAPSRRPAGVRPRPGYRQPGDHAAGSPLIVPDTAGQLYLIDTSAQARIQHPAVRAIIAGLIADRAAATAVTVDLEAGYSGRSASDVRAIAERRQALYVVLPISKAIAQRARDVQVAMAAAGQHRAAGVIDLLTAAVAEYQ